MKGKYTTMLILEPNNCISIKAIQLRYDRMDNCRATLQLSVDKYVQYIPRNMHTVFALLCFVVVIHWLIFPYPSGLLHWHCGNITIAPVPGKLPWWIWINTSCEIIMNDYITTTKQSTTKPCAYLLGYTVRSIITHTSVVFNSSLFCFIRSTWLDTNGHLPDVMMKARFYGPFGGFQSSIVWTTDIIIMRCFGRIVNEKRQLWNMSTWWWKCGTIEISKCITTSSNQS